MQIKYSAILKHIYNSMILFCSITIILGAELSSILYRLINYVRQKKLNFSFGK